MRTASLALIAAIIGFGVVYGVMPRANSPSPIAALASGAKETAVANFGLGCTIKGNVSFNSGERIYHVPGQYYYNETIITPTKGERWFCTEADARAAGWRKAGY